jgi:DNA-directed RNA polymerase subunit RPC12/RpoP
MSEFKFSCPHCDQHLQCDDRLGGKQIQCPACNHLIVIPPSPSQQAQGNYSPDSGQTWATYIAPKPKQNKPPEPPPQ